MTDISVIVINKGMEDHVESCLASLFSRTAGASALPGQPSAEVILVSNSSNDFRAGLAQRYPDLTVIPTHEPLSVSRYRNLGIEASSGRYVLALDADTTVFSDTLAKVVEFMDAHPEAGCAGGQLLFSDGRIQPSGRGFYTWGSMIFRRTPLQRWFPNSRVLREYLILDWDRTTVREVDWVGTGFYAMRRSVIDEIGAFDEAFVYGMEEIDWCLRAKLAGYATLYMPEARITHYEHKGTQPSRRLLNWFGLQHLKSIFHYHDKHGWWRLSARRRRRDVGKPT